jgi:hypothetical protein
MKKITMKIILFSTALLLMSIFASAQSEDGEINGRGLSFIPIILSKGQHLVVGKFW